MMGVFEIALTFGPLIALWGEITGFYGRSVCIGLGEILPWEVRLVGTIALVLPMVFLLGAGWAFTWAIIARGVLKSLGDFLQKIAKPSSQ